MNRKILMRKYFAVLVQLASPLNVSSGADQYSDSDVLRNGRGEVFVPGTSLAGAFRNWLKESGISDDVMGFSSKESGKQMSSFYISDLYFHANEQCNVKVSLRDRIQLDSKKAVNNKFDTEIVEPGVEGTLFVNYVQRQGDTADLDKIVCGILQEIESGAIRFGANKNRGYGRFRVLRIFEKKFTDADVDEWISFASNSHNLSSYGEGISYQEWEATKEKPMSGYLKIQVPLQLKGGISIRRYSTRPGMPDFEHINCGKDEMGQPIPVIPGTSWNGAIRAGALSILGELVGKKRAERVVRGWFGHVEKNKTEKGDELGAWQSAVVIAESRIKGGTWLAMMRNQINRFDASTKTGALYSEWSYFGGVTKLELMVRKEAGYQALVGMLLLVIADLQKGYLCVGGQTAVGRGVFEKNGDIFFSEAVDEELCNRALYDFLFEQEME